MKKINECNDSEELQKGPPMNLYKKVGIAVDQNNEP